MNALASLMKVEVFALQAAIERVPEEADPADIAGDRKIACRASSYGVVPNDFLL